MDINTIANYIDLSQAINLNNLFVVVQEFDGVTFYYGCKYPSNPAACRRYSSLYQNAKDAIRFSSKEEAQKKCDELNAKRKRIEFKVDEASKHFVSNFNLVFNERAQKGVILTNIPVSIQDAQRGVKANTTITKEMIDAVVRKLNRLNRGSKYFVDNISQITSQKMRELVLDFNGRVLKLNNQLTKNLQMHRDRLDAVDNLTKFLTDGTIERLVAQSRTTNDDNFEILYGSSNK